MLSFIIKKSIIVLICIVYLTNLSYSQEKPYAFGKVTDGKTGEPLINANVFLSNTMKGASTNIMGDYIIRNIEQGTYNLTVSYVGYESQIMQVRFDKIKGFKFNFKLKEKVNELPVVTVEGKKPKDWKKNFRKFTQYFLGTSDFGNNCEILNPYVMDFDYDKKSKYFKAIAEDILEIENKSLGYLLHYTLLEFKVEDNLLYYLGEQLFEEMVPKNEKERAKWAKNREKAFKGSTRHFLKSLVDSTSFLEGYIMKHLDVFPPDNFVNIAVENPDTLFKKIGENEYELNFTDILEVVYLSGKPLDTKKKIIDQNLFNGNTLNLDPDKEKIIKYPTSHFVVRSNPILFNKEGILNNPLSLRSYDTWPSYKIGELLPREYKVGRK